MLKPTIPVECKIEKINDAIQIIELPYLWEMTT